MNSSNLALLMKKCMSPQVQERAEGIKSLQEVQRLPGFSPIMLGLSSDSTTSKEIVHNAAIQLKNYVSLYWKIKPTDINTTDQEKIIIPFEDKEYIKANILPLLASCTSKPLLKLYMQIINIILRNEKEWSQFLPYVVNYMRSSNQFEILCGVSSFYQMSKVYDFEISELRDKYFADFSSVCENFEMLLEGLMMAFIQDIRLFSDEGDQFLSMKILYKLLKIFYSTIQMGIPNVLMEQGRLDKWINYLMFLIKLNFPDHLAHLNRNPNSVEELELLRKSYLWKVKYVCYDILYKLYEKYGTVERFGKNEYQLQNFSKYLENSYAKSCFETFLYVIYQSKENYVEEEIICMAYQYFQLILNRRDRTLFPLLEANVETIVKDHLIQGGVLTVTDFEMMKNNQKQYIYKQFEKGLSFENKRFAIGEFVDKLCEYSKATEKKRGRGRQPKNKPEYLDFVYNFLINSLNSLEAQIKELNPQEQFSNFNYLLLLKESCVRILESIYSGLIRYYENNLEVLITTFLINDLDLSYSHTLPWMRERAFSFILQITSSISFTNEELLKHLVNQTCQNMSSNNNELFVIVKCALIIPKLLQSNQTIKELLRSNIVNVFSIYLKLIQELDLEQLFKCLEELVNVYPKEVIAFSVDLTKELVMSFNRFMQDDETNNGGEQSQELNILADTLDEDGDENYSVNTACGIIKTLNKILQVCAKENVEVFYQIENLISQIIHWAFSSDNQQILPEIIDIIFTIVSSPPVITDTAWMYYSELLNCLISFNNSQIEEGLGFENIQEVISILLNYMVKEPEKFLIVADRKGNNIMSKTIEYIPLLISLSKQKNDEVSCGCVVKILLTMLETYKENLDNLLKDILTFTINQMKEAKQGFYKMLLLQTIALAYVYNAKLTNLIIEEMNLTGQIFEMWIPMINNMRFDFEYRRTALAFTSLLLIEENLLNPIVKDNLLFIFNKIVELLKKVREMREKKKVKEEADVSGDENDSEEEIEESDKLYKSKTKHFKMQIKDFIDDDINLLDDEDDEDYNELENSFDNQTESSFKTRLDLQDECLYLRDVLNFLRENNPLYYDKIMSQINENVKYEIGFLIQSAEQKILK